MTWDEILRSFSLRWLCRVLLFLAGLLLLLFLGGTPLVLWRSAQQGEFPWLILPYVLFMKCLGFLNIAAGATLNKRVVLLACCLNLLVLCGVMVVAALARSRFDIQ